ncbi:MAG: low molecular weight phosphatase family protein [Caulobacterales bacterium]|jgi:protein-tyrosine-phosphatase
MAAPLALPQAVLFACNFNCVRSVMAEGLVKRRFSKRIWVESVGVRAGEGVDPFVVVVMDELGVDVTRHRPRRFVDLEDSTFDLIVSLTPEAHHQALEFTRTYAVEVEYWPTFDPTLASGSRDQMLDAYRVVRDGLDKRIAERFQEASTP